MVITIPLALIALIIVFIYRKNIAKCNSSISTLVTSADIKVKADKELMKVSIKDKLANQQLISDEDMYKILNHSQTKGKKP
jgi:hypothetical protein